MIISPSPSTSMRWSRPWAARWSSRSGLPSQGAGQQGESLPIVGRSPAMQEIYRIIARLTQTDLTVMIVGESGTGKELVARALHDYGRRRKGPFVAVNMAAIPRELIESELFGHEKGAFTGATSRMAGRFEQAEGGTLFLDEIGDMPLEAQTRLLRVLQQGEYTTVGGNAPIKTNVRIITATHRDLRQLINQGSFREDLFYRLNVVPLRLPPLRERAEDIPDLVRHFLARAVKEGLPRKELTREAVDRLQSHRWPGNIRELENLLRRLVAIEIEDTIAAPAIERELASVPVQSASRNPWISPAPAFLNSWRTTCPAISPASATLCRPWAFTSASWRRWSRRCSAPCSPPPPETSSARRSSWGSTATRSASS
jgi:two-component system, NtrC family, nitrogen regulation response regulator GlnG